MRTLPPSERRALRAKAHTLHPVVIVGHHGLTPAVLKEIDTSLRAHELIKVRVADDDRAVRDEVLRADLQRTRRGAGPAPRQAPDRLAAAAGGRCADPSGCRRQEVHHKGAAAATVGGARAPCFETSAERREDRRTGREDDLGHAERHGHRRKESGQARCQGARWREDGFPRREALARNWRDRRTEACSIRRRHDYCRRPEAIARRRQGDHHRDRTRARRQIDRNRQRQANDRRYAATGGGTEPSPPARRLTATRRFAAAARRRAPAPSRNAGAGRAARRASEAECLSGMSEQCARRRPIEAQSAAIARAMASICNDERASSGLMSGHDSKALSLSDVADRQHLVLAHAAGRLHLGGVALAPCRSARARSAS